MTKVFSFITLLIFLTNSVFCQVGNGKGVRVFIEKPNTNLYKQTIVAFTDASTDGVDQNDAVVFGGAYLFTEINNQAYTINAFGPLTEDKTIPLKTAISPDTGLFIIGIDSFMTYGNSNEERLLVGLFDNSTNTLHNLETPYVFQGPTANRFSLIFETPITVDVFNGCEVGYLVINNDTPDSSYYLTRNNEFIGVFTSSIDTIFNLTNGDYILSLPFENLYEEISFTVDNTIIDASLSIPYTNLYLGDSWITPFLSINSQYNSIEWDFGDGNFFFNDINPVHYYSQSGVYNLKVTISEFNCVKVFEVKITINEPLSLNFIDYKNIPKHKPSEFYYAIDGRLVKKR